MIEWGLSMRRELIDNMLGRPKKQVEPIKTEPVKEPVKVQSEDNIYSPNVIVISQSEMLNAIYQQNRIIIALLEKAIAE